MRSWVKQEKKNQCGQVALSVVLEISVDAAIREVGKKGCTTTKDLVKVLRKFGYIVPNRTVKLDKLPELSISKLISANRKSGWHWIVIDSNKIWDGISGNSFGVVHYPPDWKITSHLPITKKYE